MTVYNDEITSLLIKNKLEIKKKNPGLEPELIFDVTDSNPDFQAVRPTLLQGLCHIRTYMRYGKVQI